jgi:hypothetical protein
MSVDYGKHDDEIPVYGVDMHSNWDGYRAIVCKPEKMNISAWLRPIYGDVSEIAVNVPVSLSRCENIVASGNRDSSGTMQGDLWLDNHYGFPFAAATKIGLGYVVFIAGIVSTDSILEHYPGNGTWLANLGKFLVHEAEQDRRRREPAGPVIRRPSVAPLDLETLINGGESETVEFKIAACRNPYQGTRDDSMKDNIVQKVAAFMNSHGGLILIGIADDGTVKGIHDDYEVVNSKKPGRDGYELFLRDAINGQCGANCTLFYGIQFVVAEGKDVCAISVSPAAQPTYVNGELFIRSGNQRRKLKAQEAASYLREHWPNR